MKNKKFRANENFRDNIRGKQEKAGKRELYKKVRTKENYGNENVLSNEKYIKPT